MLPMVRWGVVALWLAVTSLLLVFACLSDDVMPLGCGVWVGDSCNQLSIGRLDPEPVEFSWSRGQRQEWWDSSGQFMYSGEYAIRLRHLWFAWFVLACACAALVLHWVFGKSQRRQRLAGGRCLACDYDRSGLPDDIPCPECGVVQNALTDASTA